MAFERWYGSHGARTQPFTCGETHAEPAWLWIGSSAVPLIYGDVCEHCWTKHGLIIVHENPDGEVS